MSSPMTGLEQSVIANVVQMHHETASNIKRQQQFVDEIIADIEAHCQSDMVNAVKSVGTDWDSAMTDIYNQLTTMANLVQSAAGHFNTQDSDTASAVNKVSSTMSPVGTFLAG
jgi:hypothetical protein